MTIYYQRISICVSIVKKTLFVFLAMLFFYAAAAQVEGRIAERDSIFAEGKALYRCEMASWMGTDMMVEKYKNKENLGGYISYDDGPNNIKCIFYSKGAEPQVIGTIRFDSTFRQRNISMDLTERSFTAKEKELYNIRMAAAKVISSDTMFKVFPKTRLNLVPIITSNIKRTYILTGPQESGLVIFGNDYLLNFDADNNLVSKRSLHRNMVEIRYDQVEEAQPVFATSHTHLPESGDLITATDICTLMLYEKYTDWQKHMVVSQNYMSIWDCIDNKLMVLPRQAVDKTTEPVYKKKNKN